MLNKTNTEWAPWTVVPANRKWYRDLVICQSLVDTLESLHIKVPLKMTDEDAAKYRNQLLSEDLTRKP